MPLVEEYKGWKEYWMAALDAEFSRPGIQPDIVLAPNLEWAFKKARTMWPWADAWEFLGYVNPKDRECYIPQKTRIIERVERIKKV